MSFCFFTEWLNYFKLDVKMNSEERFFLRIILVIAAITWPFTVPFAYLELIKKSKKNTLKNNRNSAAAVDALFHQYSSTPPNSNLYD